MKLRLLASFILSASFCNVSVAELVWSPGSGWTASGGLSEVILGDSENNAQNALDLMNKARKAQEKKKYWSALGAYDDVVDDYPRSVYAPEALYQRGIIYTERHQFEKANGEFSKIIRRYPDYPKFNQVIGGIYQIGEKLGSGTRPYYWGIIPGFRNKQASLEILEGVITKAPYSEYAPLALMNIAIVAKDRREQEEAIDALDRLINNYPESTFAEDAYLNLGETYSELVQGAAYDQGATREAISYYKDFLTLYPGSEKSIDSQEGLLLMQNTLAESKLILGDFYYQARNNFRAALVFYNEAITIDPQSEAADKARAGIEKIEQGIQAPSTPVDWLFGRYQPIVSDTNYEETLEENELFQSDRLNDTTLNN